MRTGLVGQLNVMLSNIIDTCSASHQIFTRRLKDADPDELLDGWGTLSVVHYFKFV